MFNKNLSDEDKEYLSGLLEPTRKDIKSLRDEIGLLGTSISMVKDDVYKAIDILSQTLYNQQLILKLLSSQKKDKETKELLESTKKYSEDARQKLNDQINSQDDLVTFTQPSVAEKTKPRISMKKLAEDLNVTSKKISRRCRKNHIFPEEIEGHHNVYGKWQKGYYEYQNLGKKVTQKKLQFYFSNLGIEEVKKLVKE